MIIRIKDLVLGSTVAKASYAVKSATLRKTSTGKPFLSVTLFDGTDTISGNHWDYTSPWTPKPNDVVDIKAAVSEWAGKSQLNISAIQLSQEHVLEDFMPANDLNVEELLAASYKLLDSVLNADLRELATECLTKFSELWKKAPGAISMHNAYVGGALEHSLETAIVAAHISKAYEGMVDYDLTVVGALIHDIGKLFTYNFNGINIGYSTIGNLHEHIAIGYGLLETMKAKYNTENYIRIIEVLQHIILSHHGCLEYGSPVVPKCMEAFIVSQADMITSKMTIMTDATNKCEGPLTDRIYALGNTALFTRKFIDEVLGNQPTECTTV